MPFWARTSDGKVVAQVTIDPVRGFGRDPIQAARDAREKGATQLAESLQHGGVTVFLDAGAGPIGMSGSAIESDEPTVNEVNVALFPVLVVTLYGDVAERLLVKTARDLRDQLESLTGVLEVDIAGDREDLVEVLIDPVRAENYQQSQM